MSSSTFKPYAPGDLFVAATLLDNPDDDHAGQGRILQYGADLSPKGELLLADTTHLVGGLNFDAAGVLWAFDSQEFVVLNIHRDGRVVRRREFGARPLSHVNFAADGTLLFGEHVVGMPSSRRSARACTRRSRSCRAPSASAMGMYSAIPRMGACSRNTPRPRTAAWVVFSA